MTAAVRMLHGDCRWYMQRMGCVFDAMVTDPPAGIGFMGKTWDSSMGGRDGWIEHYTEHFTLALRVLKPGAHALVWAIPRTSHWTAMALENAGFEIRDRVVHLFGSGFPKSLNVALAIDKVAGAIGHRGKAFNAAGKQANRPELQDSVGRPGHTYTSAVTDAARQWEGFGTALKPACEDWWLCRKPLGERTIAANVLRYGTGALNIDGCRVAGKAVHRTRTIALGSSSGGIYGHADKPGVFDSHHAGRWPPNVVLGCACDGESHEPGCAVRMLDEQSGTSRSVRSAGRNSQNDGRGWNLNTRTRDVPRGHDDSGGASRFMYTAKATRAERQGSKHPTVKSIALMRWLVRLITKPGDLVLDPFAGSGTTGIACEAEGRSCIMIERDKQSVKDEQIRRLGPLFATDAT